MDWWVKVIVIVVIIGTACVLFILKLIWDTLEELEDEEK